jgi:uncharacterized membrane protein
VQETLRVEEDINKSINFLPVGSVRGEVYSNKAIITDAIVKAECSKGYGEVAEIKVNRFGSFSMDYLPVGNCKIYARSGDQIGFVEVSIQNGNVSRANINLDKKSVAEYSLFFVIFIIVVVVVIFFIFYKSRKPKKQKPKQDKRVNDIMKTLNKKEEAVVKYLIEHKEAYQNKIVYSTNIAKTSLARVLLNLEQKNIVSIEKIGKSKKVKLTKWFLNKEK